MFTSSELVSATSMSVSAMPAASSTDGKEALPATVRTSTRLCSSRSTSSLLSTTVTSLAGSRARLCAAVRPTCPAPSIKTFIRIQHHFQVRVGEHEPLGALLLEVHLHARLRALALEVQDHAVAEAAVAHARAELDARRGRLLARGAEAAGRRRRPECTARQRPRHLDARPHLLDQLLRDLADEARWRAEAVHAVQAALFGIADVQLLHRARDADVAEAAFLLEAVEVVERALVRKQPVLHPGQEHDGELQSLGGVQRHHLHAVFPFLGLAFAGFQRGVRQESLQRRQFLASAPGLTASASKPRAALTSSSRFSRRASPRSCLSFL